MLKTIFFLSLITLVFPRLLFASEIKINEILANPSGENSEFVEIYSDSVTDFNGYYLRDKTENNKKIISEVQTCGNYHVWELTSGEGFLNNSGEESLFLYSPQDQLIDSYENWTAADEGKTLSRYPDSSGDFTETDSTKCEANARPPEPSPSPSSNSTSSSNSSTKSTTPTPKSSPKSTSKKSPSPTPVVLSAKSNDSKNSGKEQSKLEDSISQVDPNQFNAPSPAPQNQEPSKKFAGVLMGSGTLLISMSIIGYLFYKRQEKHPAIHKEKDRFEKED